MDTTSSCEGWQAGRRHLNSLRFYSRTEGRLLMLGLSRPAMLITAVVFSAVCAGITVGIAQSPLPPSTAPPSPLPSDPLPPPTARPQLSLPQTPLPAVRTPLDPEPTVLKHISDILQQNKPVTETGNVEIDELAEILAGMGSVLDGSQLDPSLEPDHEVTCSAESERAVAAELLLKTARMLEHLGPPDRSRRQLVIQMRGEAVKLLSQ